MNKCVLNFVYVFLMLKLRLNWEGSQNFPVIKNFLQNFPEFSSDFQNFPVNFPIFQNFPGNDPFTYYFLSWMVAHMHIRFQLQYMISIYQELKTLIYFSLQFRYSMNFRFKIVNKFFCTVWSNSSFYSWLCIHLIFCG